METGSVSGTNRTGRNILICVAVIDSLLAIEGVRFLYTSRWDIYSDAIFGFCSVFFLFSSLALWIFLYLQSRYRTSGSVQAVIFLGLVILVSLASGLANTFVFGPILKALLPH